MKWINIFVCLFDPLCTAVRVKCIDLYHGVCINTMAVQRVPTLGGVYDVSSAIDCIPKAESKTVAISKLYKQ